ncbi:TPA: hypothetical protein OUE92_001740 [Serratia marcescens]|nr:hypothetical protein [Serratia marcescens]
MAEFDPYYDDESERIDMDDYPDIPDQVSPRIEWIFATYPGVVEGTEEWEQAEQDYDDWCEFQLAILEQIWFEASLNDIADRYTHAITELDNLLPLQADYQPGIVRRLAYAHCVTVMEAFLMYGACALLNHAPHLARFHDKKSKFLRGGVVKKLDIVYRRERDNNEPCLIRAREVPGQDEMELTAVTFADLQLYKSKAKAEVGSLTFHNLKKVKDFFDVMLTTSPDWPLAEDGVLKKLIETRQDLVHRNGVTKDNQPITIAPTELANAVETVRSFITLAYNDLQAEMAHYPAPEEGF